MEKRLYTENNQAKLRLHFNLKQTSDKEKLTQIMLVTTVNKHRIRVYTKLRIEPKYWDKRCNRCQTSYSMSLRDKTRLIQVNRQLNKLEAAVRQADNQQAESGKYLNCFIVQKAVKNNLSTEKDTSKPISYLYKQVEEYEKNLKIPILKEISPLISYYQKAGFPSIVISKANKVIKDLAKRCGINQPIKHKEHRGGSIHVKTQPKWVMISFHTARRSCITNLYKRGYPVNYIMTLSGHRSIQAFQRYMRATSKELMNNFVNLLKKERTL